MNGYGEYTLVQVIQGYQRRQVFMVMGIEVGVGLAMGLFANWLPKWGRGATLLTGAAIAGTSAYYLRQSHRAEQEFVRAQMLRLMG